ncbi:MAG: hypothetical protein LC808_44445 [Actinobacteria bacterium]|nr:hypothetical protein [Actinomycetota bacterium]
MTFDEADVRPGPFFYQPDPEKPFFVPAKAEKLVRRGPCEYFMVGRKPDGREVDVRLTPVAFKMESI